MLDPRRHKNKPSAADAEEYLIPYDVVLPDDHKRVLSHNYEVNAFLMHWDLVAHVSYLGDGRTLDRGIARSFGVNILGICVRSRPLLYPSGAFEHFRRVEQKL